MPNRKIYAIAAIPLGIALLFWLFTFAFDLISAASDTLVILGLLLASAGLFILLKLIQYVLKNLMP